MLHYEDKTFTVAATQDQFVATPQQLLYENHPNDSRVTGPHDVAPTIAARFGTGGGNVPFVQNVSAVAFQPGNLVRRAGSDPSTEVFPTLSKDSGDQNPHVALPMAVRRLLPSECEALQGFPKNWTQISWRGKPADQCPDGPRYKSIGNSMAVNCMAWIGRRIQLVDDLVSELSKTKG
jgi:DNA (cytosine-5)-methyltransferase 1